MKNSKKWEIVHNEYLILRYFMMSSEPLVHKFHNGRTIQWNANSNNEDNNHDAEQRRNSNKMNNKLSKGISWIFNSLFIAQHPARILSIYFFPIRYTDNTISCDLKQKVLRTIISILNGRLSFSFDSRLFPILSIPLHKCEDGLWRLERTKVYIHEECGNLKD